MAVTSLTTATTQPRLSTSMPRLQVVPPAEEEPVSPIQLDKENCMPVLTPQGPKDIKIEKELTKELDINHIKAEIEEKLVKMVTVI